VIFSAQIVNCNMLWHFNTIVHVLVHKYIGIITNHCHKLSLWCCMHNRLRNYNISFFVVRSFLSITTFLFISLGRSEEPVTIKRCTAVSDTTFAFSAWCSQVMSISWTLFDCVCQTCRLGWNWHCGSQLVLSNCRLYCSIVLGAAFNAVLAISVKDQLHITLFQ